MIQPMTLEELTAVLESQSFKSTFKGRPERPIFSFKDGIVVRDGIFFWEIFNRKAKRQF